ncbi:MAG: class I SAM-dependent methyltransferase [Alphaproteobacteria bacterium]|nr:class I SAM-dependent methyltransferase [Alphaproteobacteria bacterium]
MTSDDNRFRAYHEAVAGRPPRATLLMALDAFAAEGRIGFAVDLGAGEGRDAVALLRRGWTVLAIDTDALALTRLRARPDVPPGAHLATLHASFVDARWPQADLVNASFALPLCPAERFPELWARLRASLLPGGRFAGQLYGERDSWAERPGLTVHSRDAARALFDGWTVERFDEEETDAVTPRGEAKHWHIFNLVARTSD